MTTARRAGVAEHRARTASGATQATKTTPQKSPQARQHAPRDAQSVLLSAMSEKQFQKIVVDYLRRRNWVIFHVPNMKLTTAGLPDLLCMSHGRGMMLALELKRETGRVTPAQRDVMRMLSRVPGVEARVLRPSEWPAFRDRLEALDLDPAAPGQED